MRVLGVIGTMVWDTIWRESAADSSVQEWGGIAYALAAADAACPSDFRVRPIIKMGRDLAEHGYRFLRELSVLESDEAVSVIDAPNTRVELSYRSSQRRCERITGALPTWTWTELEPRLTGCDALYVNFITGFELDLELARRLRENFSGVIYADLHSLMLATDPRGERTPQPLDQWSEWLPCFDVVQLNEDELASLSAGWGGDPWAFAADVVGGETRLLFVTLGARGAAYVMTPSSLPFESAGRDAFIDRPEPALTGHVAAQPVEGGDPTGCGDVWGITVCCRLLAGSGVEEAVEDANAAASLNAAHRGASGLASLLKSEIGRA